ncbi:MAG TPA: S-adenosylmethionine:tRNA ribosyltransferase-isomerase [Euzebya sp.]|nr:S-adenosylmethionine:tRNA ribosyltransferase-isomerase [Euzebya sp.]
MTALTEPQVRFIVPPGRWATQPPEHRGIARDQVRLMVARPGRTDHVRFTDLSRFLRPGDVLVVNTSATRPAAINGTGPDGTVAVHLSADLGEDRWTVEMRREVGRGPVLDAAPGDLVALEHGGHMRLGPPAAAGPGGRGVRLWTAHIQVPGGDVNAHMQRHGRPITYGQHKGSGSGRVGDRLPLATYQTVFARHPGSAEMASAGRPFSNRLVTQLASAGVLVLPITLHAGVSSQEAGEAPQPEWFDVPAPTAAAASRARQAGGRVVAVGTTVTRALESAWAGDHLRPARGWTDLVITPERGVHAVDGLITGWHEADASHLLLLEAVAGAELVQQAYAEAVAGPYLWHEFGDSCLLLP